MNNIIYPYIDKIVLFGPYIGDWKEEITAFRPYIKWIYDNVEFADYYVATHFNRAFMYEFIKEENFLPIYESLTRDEHKQKNAIHKDIKTKDYSSIILRNIRDEISNNTGYLKKDIVQYSLSYIKSIQNFSISNKKFTQIPYEEDEEKNKIVFIPDKRCKRKVLEKILKHLDKNYPDDYVVIGDEKTYFAEENIVRKRIDYLEYVYKLIVDYISNAKIVICPCGHWTILSNQQGSYVFSWGEGNIAQYKSDGVYGFGNKNSIINIQKSFINNKLMDHIDWSIEKFTKE